MKPSFLDEIDRALAVRQHVILTFNTQDLYYWPEGEINPSSLNFFIASHLCKVGYRVAVFLPAMGVVREVPEPGNQTHEVMRRLATQASALNVMKGLFALLRNPNERWIVLVLYGEHLAPTSVNQAGISSEEVQIAEILHQLAVDDDIASGRSRIILVTYESMPVELLSRSPAYRRISVDLPSVEERGAYIKLIERLRANGRHEFGALEEGLSVEELTGITAGIPLVEILGLYRSAAHFQRPVSRAEVREVKARAIRQLAQDLVEVSEPQAGFQQVAGLQTLKDYVGQLVIPQIRAGRPAPQALLLHGEPGCGKSHVVQALACELGWPLLEMRSVRSPWVGQSEQQLERVITVVEQLAPCVFFFDEIDQLLGQRSTGGSNDSGTSERLLARIFNWLGSMHLRGRVLFIGASNRPDLLDPALLDRFRVSIPILKPSAGEIKEMLPMLAARFGRTLAPGVVGQAADFLAPLRPSGRSLQEILIQAGLRADAINRALGSAIESRHLRAATDDHLCADDPLELEFIRLRSLAMASNQSLLPWNGLDGMRAGAEIPADLLEQQIVDDRGRLNTMTLNGRLRELAAERQNARWMR
ncbi:MAG: ATP-binding protein [Desulfobulbaceae bacterium]|nr:MAG: ATP-binding protein [Desulfobulbaceae bacterium]